MHKYLYFLIALLFISCGKDDSETIDQLVGIWVLQSVDGTCTGVPLNANADESGCIDVPLLEVNCSIIEVQADGSVQYAYSAVTGSGSLTVNGNTVTICTDRCLDYEYDGTVLTLQTGTISLCDPVYTFEKTTSSLDDLLASRGKAIDKVFRNGKLIRSYTYDNNDELTILTLYNEDGDIRQRTQYSYEPFKTIANVDIFNSSSSFSIRYEYYEEAPGRLRRDSYNTSGELSGYRLYFRSQGDCGLDRTETYSENDELERWNEYDYSGDNCDQELNQYVNGVKVNTFITEYDGMNYWASSAVLDQFSYIRYQNTTSYTMIEGGDVRPDQTYTATFTYDSAGFPTTESRVYMSGEAEVYSYEYVD